MSSSSSTPAAPAPRRLAQAGQPRGWVEPRNSGFSMPMQSKEDVLLEEIQYLRHMLTDSNEEKRIEIAIVRDEVTEKQHAIDLLTRQKAMAEARLRAVHGELAHVVAPQSLPFEQRKAELDQRDADLRSSQKQIEVLQELEGELRKRWADAEARCQALGDDVQRGEHTTEDMRKQVAAREHELRQARKRLAYWEAPEEALAALGTEGEVVAWENELRGETQEVLARLADRRVELRAAAIAKQSKDGALCKICYDRTASCALLPCRHHALCAPCGERVWRGNDPACPLCRTPISDMFETFSG